MLTIRPAGIEDLVGIQNCNLTCLPENYTFKYYYYHYVNWPSISFVAEDTATSKIVGYVLANVSDEEETPGESKGHVTSISVLREYRRMGLAKRLMEMSHQAMKDAMGLNSVTLHVRASNHAAIGLYQGKLGYTVVEQDVGYYADGEDALYMKKVL